MKISAQKAIKNFCKGCIYDRAIEGTWLQQVENCTVVKCELYDHRPKTSKTKKKEREAYLATLTYEQRTEVENRAKNARKNMADLRKGAQHEE